MKQIFLTLVLSTTLLIATSSKVDEKSGLIWQDNQDVAQVTLNYSEAKNYCKALKVDTYEDWRLPTVKEFYTIVDLTQNRPALKNGFEVRDDGKYWTSTPFAKNPKKEAWYISMSYGEAEAYNMNRVYHVRCVRNHKIQK